jgi:hypothetical protein
LERRRRRATGLEPEPLQEDTREHADDGGGGHHTSPDARVEMTLGRTSAPIKPHRVQTIREQRDRTDVSSDLSALITIQIRVRSPRLEQSGGVMELIGDLGKKLTELTLLEGRVFRPQGSNLDQRVR